MVGSVSDPPTRPALLDENGNYVLDENGNYIYLDGYDPAPIPGTPAEQPWMSRFTRLYSESLEPVGDGPPEPSILGGV